MADHVESGAFVVRTVGRQNGCPQAAGAIGCLVRIRVVLKLGKGDIAFFVMRREGGFAPFVGVAGHAEQFLV